MEDIWLVDHLDIIPHPTRKGSDPRVPSAPPRGHIHTSEGPALDVMKIAHGDTPYHVVVEIKKRRAIQVLPLNKTGYSLYHPKGSPETNHMGLFCVGVCIHDVTARDMHTLTDEDLKWFAETVILPISQACSIPLETTVTFYGTDAGFILATETAIQRLSWSSWTNFSGWCGHQHVPGNNHWDPGKLNIGRIFFWAREKMKAMTETLVDSHVQLISDARIATRAALRTLKRAVAKFSLTGIRLSRAQRHLKRANRSLTKYLQKNSSSEN